MTTQEYKEELRRNVSPEDYQEALYVASQVLRNLPNKAKLGNTTAGLMLAGIAFAENAMMARALVQQPLPEKPK